MLVLIACPLPLVWAEDSDSANGSVPEWAEDGHNELAVFVGITDVAGDAGGSLGLDYEYRFTRVFGLGATAEYTAANLREWLFAASFNFHVWKELKIIGAPGVETETEDGTDSFVFRVGVEYGFDIGRGWEAAPALNFDMTSEDTAIVLGVGFGRHF
jgi:hypothetical protein